MVIYLFLHLLHQGHHFIITPIIPTIFFICLMLIWWENEKKNVLKKQTV